MNLNLETFSCSSCSLLGRSGLGPMWVFTAATGRSYTLKVSANKLVQSRGGCSEVKTGMKAQVSERGRGSLGVELGLEEMLALT